MAKRQYNRPWKSQVQEQRRIIANAHKVGALTIEQRERLYALAGTSKRARHRIDTQLKQGGLDG